MFYIFFILYKRIQYERNTVMHWYIFFHLVKFQSKNVWTNTITLVDDLLFYLPINLNCF
jgi:hypothetical protein